MSKINLSPQVVPEGTYTKDTDALNMRTFKRTVTNKDKTVYTTLQQLADAIILKANSSDLTSVAGRVTAAEGSIVVQAGQIALKAAQTVVDGIGTRLSSAEGSIIVQAGQIATKAAQSTVDALTGRVSSAEGSIVVQAGQIASKVASTDYNGTTIASLINQTAASVKIQAGHIQLEGIVTANTYFKINADGSMETVAGKIGQWIINNQGLYNIVPDGGQNNNSTGLGGPNTDWAIWAGNGRFRVTQAGYLYATNADITGVITATSGRIAGWYIGSSSLYKGGLKLDSANERIYVGSSAYLYGYNGTTLIGIKGGLVIETTISIGGLTYANGGLAVKFGGAGTLYYLTRDANGYVKAI